MNDPAARLYARLLVLRCQTGEESALAELIADYSPRLRFYLRKMAGDSSADDLLQDVWVDVVRNFNRLQDPDALPGWIYRIARDKAYRDLRRRRRYVPLPPQEESAGTVDDVEQPWTAEDADQVRSAMDLLPAQHREVLALRFVEDMDYEQIASVVGAPVGTVRSRLFYAKRALRKAIERKGHHERERTRQSVAQR
ncbi:MAG TPA: sigma-70 family RNA polymerase sigma factor [Tepidisphaeraceae bacterium]|jgi:RNA polymerase sigma-70 factor (ECF subfamily)